MMQFVLLLLSFPAFVFFGIEGYSSFNAGSASVAKVAGRSITQAEWEAAHRNFVEAGTSMAVVDRNGAAGDHAVNAIRMTIYRNMW